MASALHYVNIADGMGVLLHVAWAVLTNYMWHHDIMKLFYLFLWEYA